MAGSKSEYLDHITNFTSRIVTLMSEPNNVDMIVCWLIQLDNLTAKLKLTVLHTLKKYETQLKKSSFTMNFILKRKNDLLILSSKTQQISENSLETTSETLFPFSEPVYSMMNFLNQENFSNSEFKCNLQKHKI